MELEGSVGKHIVNFMRAGTFDVWRYDSKRDRFVGQSSTREVQKRVILSEHI